MSESLSHTHTHTHTHTQPLTDEHSHNSHHNRWWNSKSIKISGINDLELTFIKKDNDSTNVLQGRNSYLAWLTCNSWPTAMWLHSEVAYQATQFKGNLEALALWYHRRNRFSASILGTRVRFLYGSWWNSNSIKNIWNSGSPDGHEIIVDCCMNRSGPRGTKICHLYTVWPTCDSTATAMWLTLNCPQATRVGK